MASCDRRLSRLESGSEPHPSGGSRRCAAGRNDRQWLGIMNNPHGIPTPRSANSPQRNGTPSSNRSSRARPGCAGRMRPPPDVAVGSTSSVREGPGGGLAGRPLTRITPLAHPAPSGCMSGWRSPHPCLVRHGRECRRTAEKNGHPGVGRPGWRARCLPSCRNPDGSGHGGLPDGGDPAARHRDPPQVGVQTTGRFQQCP